MLFGPCFVSQGEKDLDADEYEVHMCFNSLLTGRETLSTSFNFTHGDFDVCLQVDYIVKSAVLAVDASVSARPVVRGVGAGNGEVYVREVSFASVGSNCCGAFAASR